MKPGNDGALTGSEVVQLSKKLQQMDLSVNAHYRGMIANSLLGHEPKMDGRPVVPITKFVQQPNGKRGIVIAESPEEQAFQRWKDGQFKESEALLAQRWKESTRTVDLESLSKIYQPFTILLSQVRNFSQLVAVTDRILCEPKAQTILLEQIIYEFRFHPKMASEVFHRWEQGSFPTIKEFAKYAYYCFHVNFAFYVGIAHRLLGTRATNRIDLEYAYYVPFAMAFSSRDNFHKTFVPPFLRSGQSFLDGDALKADLKAISDYLSQLSPEDLQEYQRENGSYPPQRPDSITNELWERHMLPRSELTSRTTAPPPRSGTPVREIPELDELLKPEHSWTPEEHELEDESYDFIIREHNISISDPCPCKSGKKFRDCHWNEVKDAQPKHST